MNDYKPVKKSELHALAEKEGARIGKRLYKEWSSVNLYYGDTFTFKYTCDYKFNPPKKEVK